MPPRAGAFVRIHDPSPHAGERWYINDHTIVRDRTGLWHLFGITHAEPAKPHDEKHLAHATAPDLHGPWTTQPFALSADAERLESVLWAPHVIEHDGRYWMFVCGGGPNHLEYRIVLATSTDCFHWTRADANPLLVDGYEARDPMVRRIGDRWVMYYAATTTPAGGNFVVVATESDDLLHWHGRRIVYTDRCTGTYGGPTESPFVVERGGRYYLFIGPDWEGLLESHARTGRYDPASYRRTRVLVSDDPFDFRSENQVATIDAHAAEVIDDGERTWVSHCGWGQKGVWLAPLDWDDVPRGVTRPLAPSSKA
jgi:sucrose-6-phosphate hydrolase SacC (GH32 family)